MISAVVPTCGASERLAQCVESVRASLAGSGDLWELLVVDDGGALKGVPEGARLLSLPRRGGYGPAVNAGVQAAQGDHLLILNDDVRLEEPAARLLHQALRGEGCFAVVPRILSSLARDGDEAGKRGAWRAGLIEIEETASAPACATLYPVGCCYLCRRADFIALGGYDPVFAPYLWEDVDLGYRAWRCGLSTRTVPDAICHHAGSATIGERPMRERLSVWFRNQALFHLRNVQDPRRRAEVFGALAAIALFDQRDGVQAGLAAALTGFEEVGARPMAGLADDAILAQVSRT